MPLRSQEIQDIQKNAEQLEQTGKWQQAIEIWSKLLDDDSQSFWAHYRIGLAYYALDQLEAATEKLRVAITRNPLHPNCQLNYLRCLVRLGSVDKSLFDGSIEQLNCDIWTVGLIEDIKLLMTYQAGVEIHRRSEVTYIDSSCPVYDVAEHDGLIRAVLNTSVTHAVAGGNWDELGRPVEEFDVYVALRLALFERQTPWQDTHFYKDHVERINSGDYVWNCETVAQFDERLTIELPNLIEKIRDQGMKTQIQLGGWDPLDDIRIGVARNGELIFLNGQHRLSIGKLLRLNEIPVRIVLRHVEWQRLRDDVSKYASENGGRIYQQIDHPDLCNIPAVHTLERFSPVLDIIKKEVKSGGRVLEIGSHWGAGASLLGHAGYRCVAVENDPAFLPFTRKLTARYKEITVFEGNIFDYGDMSDFDAIIAMNIFHHFLRTESSFQQFNILLKKLPKTLLFVQTHNPETVDKNQGFYKQFGSEDLLKHIVQESSFTTYERIFVESDGRPVYVMR